MRSHHRITHIQISISSFTTNYALHTSTYLAVRHEAGLLAEPARRCSKRRVTTSCAALLDRPSGKRRGRVRKT